MSNNHLKIADIFKFKMKDRTVLLNNDRFTVFLIDPIEADILDLGDRIEDLACLAAVQKRYGNDNVRSAFDRLEKMGVIAYDGKKALSVKETGASETPCSNTLCLSVTDHCNMRCRYCRNGDGPFGLPPVHMSKNTARKAIDFFLEESGSRENSFIYFNGGEPSLNFDVVELCIDYGKDRFHAAGKKLTFCFVTNGFNLTRSLIDSLAEKGVILLVGIDGLPEIHNCFRQAMDGSGTHKAVYRTIRQARDNKLSKLAAITVLTQESVDIVGAVNHIRSLGIDNVVLKPVIELYREEAGIGKNLEKCGDAMVEMSMALLDRILSRSTTPEKYFINENIVETYIALIWKKTRGLIPLGSRSGRCAAGLGELGITAGGDIYPCVFFSGLPEYKLGSLSSGFDRHKLLSFNAEAEPDRKTDCQSCWARYICLGGCLRDAVSYSGSLVEPNKHKCGFNKLIAKISLYIYAVITERDPSLFEFFIPPKEFHLDRLFQKLNTNVYDQ